MFARHVSANHRYLETWRSVTLQQSCTSYEFHEKLSVLFLALKKYLLNWKNKRDTVQTTFKTRVHFASWYKVTWWSTERGRDFTSVAVAAAYSVSWSILFKWVNMLQLTCFTFWNQGSNKLVHVMQRLATCAEIGKQEWSELLSHNNLFCPKACVIIPTFKQLSRLASVCDTWLFTLPSIVAVWHSYKHLYLQMWSTCRTNYFILSIPTPLPASNLWLPEVLSGLCFNAEWSRSTGMDWVSEVANFKFFFCIKQRLFLTSDFGSKQPKRGGIGRTMLCKIQMKGCNMIQ